MISSKTYKEHLYLRRRHPASSQEFPDVLVDLLRSVLLCPVTTPGDVLHGQLRHEITVPICHGALKERIIVAPDYERWHFDPLLGKLIFSFV